MVADGDLLPKGLVARAHNAPSTFLDIVIALRECRSSEFAGSYDMRTVAVHLLPVVAERTTLPNRPVSVRRIDELAPGLDSSHVAGRELRMDNGIVAIIRNPADAVQLCPQNVEKCPIMSRKLAAGPIKRDQFRIRGPYKH